VEHATNLKYGNGAKNQMSRELSALKYGRSSACFITFHRVASAREWASHPHRDFYINLDFLDALLSFLPKQGWRICTIDDILAEPAQSGARLVNFSIDDCYQDTSEALVPLFRKHKVPVTLFVTTGIPDKRYPLAMAGLETVIAGSKRIKIDNQCLDTANHSEKRQVFQQIFSHWLRTDVDREYARFCEANCADPADHWEQHAITWPMLEALARDPLVEIGAHTVSHPRLTSLSADAVLNEMRCSAERLRERLGIAVRHFAFPFGRERDCGPREFALAREAGFESSATTRRGLFICGDDRFSLPRNNLSGGHQSLLRTRLTLAGLNAIGARLRGLE
jgi:peptidoglycan/xylan/chitin deacetylase (PgdA/CDA1 family)